MQDNDDIVYGLAEISLWLANNGHKDFSKTIDAACDKLSEMQWVSTDEQMPAENKDVLVTDGTDVWIAALTNVEADLGSVYYEFVDQHDWKLEFDEVSHWMPRPKPPKRPVTD